MRRQAFWLIKTKTAADRVSESIVDVMGFVNSSTKRIAAM
jgi:hypothetical protein